MCPDGIYTARTPLLVRERAGREKNYRFADTEAAKSLRISRTYKSAALYNYKSKFESSENLTRPKIYDIIYIRVYIIYIKL